MAFDALSGKLKEVFKKLSNKGKLSEADVKEAMRHVRLALLEADVNYKIAKDFVATVSEKAVGEQVMQSLTPGQQVIKIVNDELVALMGGSSQKLEVASKPPTVILLCGLQGAGKTTFAAKLAQYLKKNGKKPVLAACDIYRPAAIEQLKVLGKQIDVPVFYEDKDAVSIANDAVKYANSELYDTVIVDTAGRLHIDDEMMGEITAIKKAVNPTEILLVADAMTGQEAVNIAQAFDDALDITGVVLTKLDGDARGGAALSIKAVTGKPIKFAGVGEKLDNIEVFHPDRMASRILGMGDVMTLIERAQETFDEESALEMSKKLKKAQFTLDDFLEQFQSIRQMGGASEIMGMLPGNMTKGMSGGEVDEKQIVK
ncbi:signal recognition particle protein, partial [Eubacteriales bacterium OttesenSCG-928-N14]|nr:signal recognition particle protein [Eubacteriales bacterium OttesenSCG-928-N14]